MHLLTVAKQLMVAMLVFIIAAVCFGETHVSGNISGEQRWTFHAEAGYNQGQPYYIDGNVTLTSGTLFIEDGVEVIITDDYLIKIGNGGRIEAVGKPSDDFMVGPLTYEGARIVFHPGEGITEWQGIEIGPTSTIDSRIEHCHIIDASTGIANFRYSNDLC